MHPAGVHDPAASPAARPPAAAAQPSVLCSRDPGQKRLAFTAGRRGTRGGGGWCPLRPSRPLTSSSPRGPCGLPGLPRQGFLMPGWRQLLGPRWHLLPLRPGGRARGGPAHRLPGPHASASLHSNKHAPRVAVRLSAADSPW